MKRFKNAINKALNIYFMSVCILICISLKLPDNNHVRVRKYYLLVRTHVLLEFNILYKTGCFVNAITKREFCRSIQGHAENCHLLDHSGLIL